MPFPTEEKIILETEAKLNVRFPAIYRAKMKQKNGGAFNALDDHWYLFPFFDTSDKKRSKRTSNHIIRETTSARESLDFPVDAIAIAENNTGDILFFRRSKNGIDLNPEVYLYNHEGGSVLRVTDDFGELIGL